MLDVCVTRNPARGRLDDAIEKVYPAPAAGRPAKALPLANSGSPAAAAAPHMDLWKNFFCRSGQNSDIKFPIMPPVKLVFNRPNITDPRTLAEG